MSTVIGSQRFPMLRAPDAAIGGALCTSSIPPVMSPLAPATQPTGDPQQSSAFSAEWDSGPALTNPAIVQHIGQLRDTDPFVRRAAAEKLGEFRDTRATPRLIELFSDEDPHVREAAVGAFAFIRDQRAVVPLIERLEVERDHGIRTVIVKAIGRQNDRRTVPLVIGLLAEEDPKVRKEAAEILRKVHDPRATSPLIERLKVEKDSEVCISICNALYYTYCTARFDPRVIPILRNHKDYASFAESAVKNLERAQARQNSIRGSTQTHACDDQVSCGVQSENVVGTEAYQDTFRGPQKIARHPLFEQWCATTDHPNAHLVRILAERLSWDQVAWIRSQNGFSFLAPMKGCIHLCRGCFAGVEFDSAAQRTSWEEYTNRIKALVGLEIALKSITGREYAMFDRRSIQFYSYYQNDPMATVLRNESGESFNMRDIAKFVFEETGLRPIIETSGWNPRNSHMETAAGEIERDVVEGHADYIAYANLNIKTASRFFISDVERFMRGVLTRDHNFQERFGADYQTHGFDFSRYQEREEVKAEYARLVREHLGDILDASRYLQDRIENIRTFLPAILAGKINLTFFVGNVRGHPPSMAPLLDSKGVRAFISCIAQKLSTPDRIVRLDCDDEHVRIRSWEWKAPEFTEYRRREEFGNLYIGPSGLIAGTGSDATGAAGPRPNPALSGDHIARSFSYSAVFYMEGPLKARWRVAGEELTHRSYLELTPEVRQSVMDRIRDNQAELSIEVRTVAEYQEIEGKRTPVVKVRINNKDVRWFNLLDGALYAMGGVRI